MKTVSKMIFENQDSPKIEYLQNQYDNESMTIQVNCDVPFILIISGRINSKFPYQQMDLISITRSYSINSAIGESGIYSLGVTGVSDIQFELESIDNGKLNCFVNMG